MTHKKKPGIVEQMVPPPFDDLPEPPRITLEEARAKTKGYVTEEELGEIKKKYTEHG